MMEKIEKKEVINRLEYSKEDQGKTSFIYTIILR